MKPVNITLTAENTRIGDCETVRYDFHTGWNTNFGDSARPITLNGNALLSVTASIISSIEDMMVMMMIVMTYQQRSRRRIHTPLRNKWW